MSIRNSYSPAPALQTSYMCEKWKIRWNYVKKYLIFFEFIKAKATRVNTSHPIEGRRFAQLTASRFTYFFCRATIDDEFGVGRIWCANVIAVMGVSSNQLQGKSLAQYFQLKIIAVQKNRCAKERMKSYISSVVCIT